jgi:transcriptional regulator with XRE-family HTH domain
MDTNQLKKLKEAREKLGLTQLEVAEKAGLNVNYYAMIERGEVVPSNKRLDKIVKLLKMKGFVLKFS